MAVITQTQLENASTDANTLEAAVNTDADIVSRLGASYKSIPKISNEANTVLANSILAIENAQRTLAIKYTFSTQTIDADPGNGQIRLNSANQNAATLIISDLLDKNGYDVSGELDQVGLVSNEFLAYFRFQKIDDATKYLVFRATSFNANAGYRQIAVENIASSTVSPFANGDTILLSFAIVGNKGEKGDTGDAGADSGLTAPDRPSLAAIVPQTNLVVILSEPQRGGVFAWRAGNYTAFVNADPNQLRYVESTVPGYDKTVGVWRRTSAIMNSDFGLDIYAISSDQQWGGPFGGSWNVSGRDELASQGTAPGSRAVKAFVHKTPGTGSNGPANGDYALFASTEKNSYLTSPNVGEIDVISAAFTQGQYSDCSAFLADGTKVGGGDGGSIMIETANKLVDGAGTPVRRIQTGVNFLEGAGGLSSGTGYGFWAEMQLATAYAGVCIDQSQASTGAGWSNLIVHAKNRNEVISRIDGVGRAYMGNGDGAQPSYSFQNDPDTGMYRLSENQLGFGIGGALRSYISGSGHTLPGSDNAYYLGADTARWAGAYFVNAPVVGSDERLKTDIQDSPLGLDFIASLRPVAYRLKHGGTHIEYEDVEVEVEEPETERKEVIREEKHFNGVRVVVKRTKKIEDVPVYDTVEVVDEDGKPVFITENKPIFDENGSPVLDKKGNQKFRKETKRGTYAVPKMRTVKKTEKRAYEVKESGKRLHYGLIAQEVKQSLDSAGVDFGGYIIDDMNDPDSMLSLRYEQFIAPLIKAVQELSAKVEKLEAKK